MKIIVDAMGGDFAPDEIVKGALAALEKQSDLQIVLVGSEEKIKELLSEDIARVEIVNATEVISNDDVPTVAIKKKTDSSMVKALELLASDDSIGGMVSSGSTGALLTGAFLKVGRIKGVSRPALAPVLPSLTTNGVVLCDCGANVDCKVVNLLHFAIMGSAFASIMLGIENPRVALLNNGTEEHKGSELTKETYAELKKTGLNFIGNVEARDLISGAADVIVSDGFNGNIALKSCEGTALGMFDLIKQNVLNGGLRAKIGALLLKPAFRQIKHKMDYSENGGACFLGVKKVVIKAHGAAKAKSVCAAVLQAASLASADIAAKIDAEINKISIDNQNNG